MIHLCKYIRKYHFPQTIMNQLYNIILAADNETLRYFSRKKTFFVRRISLADNRKCGDLHLMKVTNSHNLPPRISTSLETLLLLYYK